jgi:stage V sporulation protein AD
MNPQTIFFKTPIYLADTATIAGPKEAEGPLGKYFDKHVEDDLLGQDSYELAEAMFHQTCIKYLLNKAKLSASDIDLCIAGDLSEGSYSTNFALRDLDIPFLGVYNACASFGSALIAGATFIDSGHMEKVICSTSSHFSSAERQFRFPLEYGNQRTPLSQWTVTGAGSALLSSATLGENTTRKIKIDCATIGSIVDFGLTDLNDMGSAMAPSAQSTLVKHFRETKRQPSYYDLILTGDLGEGGSRLLRVLMEKEGYPLGENYHDGGALIYNRSAQNTNQGGSGAGCNNIVFNGYVYKKMLSGHYKRVLLVPTGALVSRTSGLQSQTVPAIAHAVSFVAEIEY